VRIAKPQVVGRFSCRQDLPVVAVAIVLLFDRIDREP
jgi:hypothetical protein